MSQTLRFLRITRLAFRKGKRVPVRHFRSSLYILPARLSKSIGKRRFFCSKLNDSSTAESATPTPQTPVPQDASGFIPADPPPVANAVETTVDTLNYSQQLKINILDTERRSKILTDRNALSELTLLRKELSKLELDAQLQSIMKPIVGQPKAQEPAAEQAAETATSPTEKKTFSSRMKTIFEWPGVLVHCSSMCSIGAMLMTDMIYLRVFVIAASTFSTVHWRIRKPTVWPAVLWGIFFGIGHLVMLVRLLLDERKIVMSEKENEVYTMGLFASAGFTGVQFRKLYEMGKPVKLAKGDVVIRKGEKKKKTFFVYKGRINVMHERKNDEKAILLSTIDSGFIGKLIKIGSDLKASVESDDKGAREESSESEDTILLKQDLQSQKKRMFETRDCWNYTLIADTEVELIEWNLDEIDEFISSTSRLKQSAVQLMYADLNQKLDVRSHLQEVDRYEELLQQVLILNEKDLVISRDDYQKLKEFRSRHDISDEEHATALAGVGWTVAEFNRGYQLRLPGQKLLTGIISIIP